MGNVMRRIATLLVVLLTMTTVNGQNFESLNSHWPKGAPNTGYAQYFIGNSYLAPLDAEHGGPVNVTF